MAVEDNEIDRETKCYDQRDAFPYRSQLRPGTREYEIYYSMHPDRKEMDDKIRVHYDDSTASDVRLRQFPDEQIPNAWVHGTKKSTGYILKDAVDGPVSEQRIGVDPVEISWKIKELAKYLGAGIVGIARLNQKWVYSHHGYPGRKEWGEAINLPHRHAIVMGFPHTWDLWLSNAKIGIPGFMDDWHFYNLMASAAVRLAIAIRDMGYPARADIQSNYNCLLPPLAVDAGLGEQCRIGVCITKEYGPAFRLVAVTTDLPLIPDTPANLGIEDFCSHCTKCADVCPSGAISRGDKIDMNGYTVWKQDVYKCFRYWNANGVSCSICRRACPWSKPRTFPHRMVTNLAQHVPPIRPFLIWADNVVYGKKPRYHPPPKWLQGKQQRMNLVNKFNYWFDHL